MTKANILYDSTDISLKYSYNLLVFNVNFKWYTSTSLLLILGGNIIFHRLNMELNLQSLFGYLCTAVLIALLDGTNIRLNWNIESDLNVNWIKFKNFLSLYWFKNKQY